MKKTWIILLIVAVALVMALPAAGKGKPDKTVEYDVTMEFVAVDDVIQSGLSTNCPGSNGVITMSAVGGHQGMLRSLNPVIWIKAPDVQWSRDYPGAGDGTGFDECHGPSVNPTGPFGAYGGALYITPGADTVEFIWHFDFYLDGDEIQRGKKTRLERTVVENFTMVTTAEYDPATGVVTGRFPISRFLNEDGNAVTTNFEPEDGTYLTFYLTITPTN
jgi:hypothetical protein